MKRTDFVFCPDDIERCVKGFRWKWVMSFFVDEQKPPIRPIWLVKIGTNLTHSEIFTLENAYFQLLPKERITPTWLLTNSVPPLDMSWICVLEHPNFIPPIRLSKVVRRSKSAPSAKQRPIVTYVEAMHGIFLKSTMISRPKFDCIIILRSKSNRNPLLPSDPEEFTAKILENNVRENIG